MRNDKKEKIEKLASEAENAWWAQFENETDCVSLLEFNRKLRKAFEFLTGERSCYDLTSITVTYKVTDTDDTFEMFEKRKELMKDGFLPRTKTEVINLCNTNELRYLTELLNGTRSIQQMGSDDEIIESFIEFNDELEERIEEIKEEFIALDCIEYLNDRWLWYPKIFPKK